MPCQEEKNDGKENTLEGTRNFLRGHGAVHAAVPGGLSAGHGGCADGFPDGRIHKSYGTLAGETTQKQALAVTTLPGLRIGAVLVSEGEQVKAGDVLFFLDMDYLEEKITQQSQEVRKQQLSVQDAWSQSNAQARQRANAKNQAEENYNAAVFSAEQKRNQARTALEQAQKQLDDFYAGVSGDSEKQAWRRLSGKPRRDGQLPRVLWMH